MLMRNSSVAVFLSLLICVMPVGSQNEAASQPLTIGVNSFSFEESSRLLTLELTLTNTKDDFYDNLVFSIELYHGDALAEEGYLFGPLDYIVTLEDQIGKIAPSETIDYTFRAVPPEEIPTGPYFFRFFIMDTRGNFYGLSYTDTAISLSGDGSFIYHMRGYVRTPYGNGLFLEGINVTGFDPVSVVMPVAENAELAGMIKAGQSFYMEAIAYPIDSNEPVHTYSKEELQISRDENGSEIMEYDLSPWVGISVGPYTIKMQVYDKDGKSIMLEPAYARLLIEGFHVRILDVSVGDSKYTAGQPLDLQAFLACWNSGEPREASVEVVLRGEDGSEMAFEKDVELVSSNMLEIDFLDVDSSKKMTANVVEVRLMDKSTGELIDSYSKGIKKLVTPVTTQPQAPPGGSEVQDQPQQQVHLPLLLLAIAVLLIVVYMLKGRSKK